MSSDPQLSAEGSDLQPVILQWDSKRVILLIPLIRSRECYIAGASIDRLSLQPVTLSHTPRSWVRVTAWLAKKDPAPP